MNNEMTEAEERYHAGVKAAKRRKSNEKYSLNKEAMVEMVGLGTRYKYQRCRIPEDKRYSIAYGIVPAKSRNKWFYWYDEVIVTLEGRGRCITRTRPTFDKEQFDEVGPTDIMFISKGTELIWDNPYDEDWVYMVVAMPAAAKD